MENDRRVAESVTAAAHALRHEGDERYRSDQQTPEHAEQQQPGRERQY